MNSTSKNTSNTANSNAWIHICKENVLTVLNLHVEDITEQIMESNVGKHREVPLSSRKWLMKSHIDEASEDICYGRHHVD
jgi:hypothetical protein